MVPMSSANRLVQRRLVEFSTRLMRQLLEDAPDPEESLEEGIMADWQDKRSLYGASNETPETSNLSLHSSSLASTSAASSSSSFNDKDGSIMIAWYCFIAVSAIVLLALASVVTYRLLRRRRAALQAQRHEQRNAALQRMQANIHKFTTHEQTQRTRNLVVLLQPQTMILEADDPRLRKLEPSTELAANEDENDVEMVDVERANTTPSDLPASPTLSSTACCCLICLEEWRQGEVVCQSAGCRHSFHQECILSWLVSHRSDCPACRQAFLPVADTEDPVPDEGEA